MRLHTDISFKRLARKHLTITSSPKCSASGPFVSIPSAVSFPSSLSCCLQSPDLLTDFMYFDAFCLRKKSISFCCQKDFDGTDFVRSDLTAYVLASLPIRGIVSYFWFSYFLIHFRLVLSYLFHFHTISSYDTHNPCHLHTTTSIQVIQYCRVTERWKWVNK